MTNAATPRPGLNFAYDEATDIFTIEGLRFTGGFFRTLGSALVGGTFAIEKGPDGVLMLTRIESVTAPFEMKNAAYRNGVNNRPRHG